MTIPGMAESPVQQPYTALAPYYDYMLRHVDYQSWYLFITAVMIHYVDNPRRVLELGTGTGRFGSKFSSDDFQIIGIDRSLEMLHVAKTRAFRNYRILCADIRNFFLKGTFDFIFSVHDTINYLLTPDDVSAMFASVIRVMDEKSVFLFDMTTEYNINRNFAGQKNRYRTRGTEILWSNSYQPESGLVTSELSFNRGGEKRHEVHVQKLYSVDFMKGLIKKAGLHLLAVYGDYEMRPPGASTVMINFIVRKK